MLITLDPMGRVMGEPTGDVGDADALDVESLGFMCGLEVHQQLATGKLHSRQAGELHDVTIDSVPEEWPRVWRKLRPAQGESGQVDVAARFEAKRGRQFIYIQSPNSGLIELDDQPPDGHDKDAVDLTLTIAGLMRAHPVPLLQTMRKTVVDGSNTSGFQRTTLVATNGVISTPDGDVGVDVICLEEDSARKLDTTSTKNGETVTWNLDRLGIPLIEIATAPEIKSPEHAKVTARVMGTILRDTRRVRRGLGSIRQDLNVSIACGDRVEIKGCQDLDWIPRIIRLEMSRQLHFYRLANSLRKQLSLPALPPDRRNTSAEVEAEVAAAVAAALPLAIHDVGKVFANCESKMVEASLADGAVMLAICLPHLGGNLGMKTEDSSGAQLPRLGRELASAAKLAGVAGIFHSDELPSYGISQGEVEAVKEVLKMATTSDTSDTSTGDAFVLCCAPAWQAELALEAVVMRARMAWHRIAQEVRNVVISKGEPADGTTTAMRPLPGGARMYPETDIPPLPLVEAQWESILANLPPTREQRRESLADTGISDDQIMQLLDRQIDDEFLAGLNTGGGKGLAPGIAPLPAKAWATTLLDSTRKAVGEAAGCLETAVPLAALALSLQVRGDGGMTREGLVPLTADILSSGAWPLGGPA
ncbi:MAG: Glu-tRNA(Gln) amidotransferase subunit GatE, partial [Pseudomonadales bacterium]|nr:Glu-tRNA(Gln) amidotransferase subunit GatE [Pseudomonadales bacterium]